MPFYLSRSGACASNVDRATTLPRFNLATFEVVVTAATSSSFEIKLLFRDQRQPFGNRLFQLASTQTKLRPSEMGVIIEAKMRLEEALSKCSSSDQL